MRRREFLTLIGSAAAAWPLAARAQQPLNPVVGFLSGRSPVEALGVVAAFRKGLSESGFVEPQNVTIDFRWAEGQFDRLPALARELIDRPVAVVAALGGSDTAAKSATTTIPIVFGTGGDPVANGLVASLNKPGGNITGVTFLTAALGAKRLGLLRDLVPAAQVIALLANPNYYLGPVQIRDVEEAARALGQTLVVLDAAPMRKLKQPSLRLARSMLVRSWSVPIRFLTLGAIDWLHWHRVPAIYQFREYAVAGGLMSYGTSITEMYRLVGLYVGRILKGEKPADLPVMQVAKFELVINLKTAKAIGVKISDNLLSLADEVIE